MTGKLKDDENTERKQSQQSQPHANEQGENAGKLLEKVLFKETGTPST